MLSEDDKKEIKEHIAKHYLLIPKNWLFHMVGGMIVTIIAIFGISYQAVLKVLDSEVAGKAKRNIAVIEKDATAAQERITRLESDSKNIIDELRRIVEQETSAAKQLIAEVEQTGKNAVEKLSSTTIESLRARNIAIVDEDGKTKMELAVSNTNAGFFALYDNNNKERLQFSENSSGYVGIWLENSEGESRITIKTDKDGLPSIDMYDSNNKHRISLQEDGNGYAGIWFQDREEKQRVLLNTTPEGIFSFKFFDSEDKQRISLYENGGYVGLGLTDRNGEQRISLLTDSSDGSPLLQFIDNNGSLVRQLP